MPVNALSGDQLDWLLDQQEVRRYEAGDVLFRQGDRDNTTIYLLSGEVELSSSQVRPHAQLRPRRLWKWVKASGCWDRSCRRSCTRATC